jgi:hypothetical protein
MLQLGLYPRVAFARRAREISDVIVSSSALRSVRLRSLVRLSQHFAQCYAPVDCQCLFNALITRLRPALHASRDRADAQPVFLLANTTRSRCSNGKHDERAFDHFSFAALAFLDFNTFSARVINGSIPVSISLFMLNNSMSTGTPLPS